MTSRRAAAPTNSSRRARARAPIRIRRCRPIPRRSLALPRPPATCTRQATAAWASAEVPQEAEAVAAWAPTRPTHLCCPCCTRTPVPVACSRSPTRLARRSCRRRRPVSVHQRLRFRAHTLTYVSPTALVEICACSIETTTPTHSNITMSVPV